MIQTRNFLNMSFQKINSTLERCSIKAFHISKFSTDLSERVQCTELFLTTKTDKIVVNISTT